MHISRRAFIQTTVVGGAGLSAFGFDVGPAYAQARTLKIQRTTETRSTCPYCSVSCGVIIHRSSTSKAIPIIRSIAAHSARRAPRSSRTS